MIPIFAKQSSNEKLATRLDALTRTLLALPIRSSGSGDSVLTQWVFEVLDSLLESKQEENLSFSVVEGVVKALLEMTPHENDAVLTPAWLALMANGFTRLSESVCEAEQALNGEGDEVVLEFSRLAYPLLVTDFFARIFKTFFNTTTPLKASIVEGASVLLGVLTECGISNGMIRHALDKYEGGSLERMVSLIETSLSNIHYREKWGHLLNVSSSIFKRFGHDCPQFAVKTLTLIMNFRDDKSYGSSFPFKLELESCLHAAIQSLGLQFFCDVVHMNIESEVTGEPRRPYLLATFGAALVTPLPVCSWSPFNIVGPHSLAFYISTFIPLADRMLTKAGVLWSESRQLEAKLFETLGLQIWDLFPLLCSNLPNDVGSSFGKLAPHVGKILTTAPVELYENLPSKADLRPIVCHALQNLVESFSLFASLEAEEGDDSDKLKWKSTGNKLGKAAIGKMKGYVNRFLSALCNLYTAVDPLILIGGNAKGQALQTLHERAIQHYEKPIKQFLKIADPSATSEYFMTMVKSILTGGGKKNDATKMGIYQTFDLMLIFLPHLPQDDLSEESSLILMYKLLIGQLKDSDATMQKKTYKALFHLFSVLPLARVDQTALVDALLDDTVVAQITTGATKLRVKVLQSIIENSEDKKLLLTFIPQALPEVMLATKETSEKSRDAAYECIIAMARKMMAGSSAMITEDDETIVGEISIKEFFIMVTAGLGGASAHMQSASVASLGRLLFEFSDQLDDETIQELIKTVLITMSFKNREVTKAALGFVKVAVVCLPLDLLELHLEKIVC